MRRPNRHRTGKKLKQRMEAEGIIGLCDECGKGVSMGFKCSCKRVECIGCWFKRTDGHKNTLSPQWECPDCGMVTLYDKEMNFIKRLTKE